MPAGRVNLTSMMNVILPRVPQIIRRVPRNPNVFGPVSGRRRCKPGEQLVTFKVPERTWSLSELKVMIQSGLENEEDIRLAEQFFSRTQYKLTRLGIIVTKRFLQRFNRLPNSYDELERFYVSLGFPKPVKRGFSGRLVRPLGAKRPLANTLAVHISDYIPPSFKVIQECVPVVVQETQQIQGVSSDALQVDKCAEFIRTLLLVKPGSLLGMPNFGSRLWDLISETITPDLLNRIKQIVSEDIAALCPDINKEIVVKQKDEHTVEVRITLSLDQTRITVGATVSHNQIIVE